MDESKAIEELQFIRKVIDETKQNVVHNGLDYIFWGILVIVGMILQFVFIVNKIFFNFVWIWAALIPIGWAFSIINKKNQKIKHPTTFAGKIIGAVWATGGIAMTIVGFVGPVAGVVTYWAISPFACLIGGMAYFISGLVLDSKLFKNISYGWWIGGVAMMFVTSYYQFLMMAFIMFFLQTIPGIVLYRKYKKQNAVIS
jgi:hypothetical protein